MKALILAGGFGKRLYPLTKNTPKSLLKVRGKPVIIDIIEKILETAASEIIIVTNSCHYNKILSCLRDYSFHVPIKVLDDHTSTEGNSLGAVGDMLFAIDTAALNDDLLVVAGDTLIEFPLSELYSFFKNKNASCISVAEVSLEKLYGMGVCQCDRQGQILGMEEKPKIPKSNLGAYAVYMLRKEDLPMVGDFINKQTKRDSPGHFFAWLCKQKPIYGYKITGSCTDIGTLEEYTRLQQNS